MNHDISHCTGVDTIIKDGKIIKSDVICPVRDKCFRYQAHLDAIKLNLTFLSYLIHSDINKCELAKMLQNETNS